MELTEEKRLELLNLHKERVLDTFKLDPQVKITLKGNEYTLEVNNWAVKQIYKETKFNLLSSGFKLAQMEDPELMGVMLFYSLVTNHPELTQESTDKMFTYRHYPYILDRMKEAISLFMPELPEIKKMLDSKEAEVDVDPT